MDRHVVPGMVRQNRNEKSTLDGAMHDEARFAEHAKPCNRCLTQGIAVCCLKARVDPNRAPLTRWSPICPQWWIGEIAIAKAGPALDILRMVWTTSFLEKFRRGTNDMVNTRDSSSDQCRILKHTNPDRKVEPFAL